MFQIIIAIVLIAFFLGKLFWQKRKGMVAGNEFYFWLFFWLAALALVLGLKSLDAFVKGLGFSASGIQVILYLSVAVIFYWIFRLRLKIEKMEENITKIVEELALRKK